MRSRKVVAVILLAAAAAAAAAVYSPDGADRLLPGAGERALRLREAIPPSIVAMLHLPPSSLKPGTASSAAGNADKPSGAQTASGSGGATSPGASSGAQNRPAVSVIAGVVAKKPLPVRIDAIGTVQPVASVALRSRIDAQIDKVMVADGAAVKAGDVLIKLDSRQIEAQIKQAEATLSKDRAQLEQANRDVARFTQLVNNQAGTQINLDNAKTAVLSAQASIMGDQAALDNLRVQLTWYTITAPISGRIGTFTLKPGNVVRSGDNTPTGTLATINQMTPIYVAFSVTQRYLGDLRDAIESTEAKVLATPQGQTRGVEGKVGVLDNSIDASTGTITARALFENRDESLWPGQLCNVRITLRTEPDVITVPRQAVQVGQQGNYVYVIENGVARVRPVTVARVQDEESIITSGLNGGETVVVDGALLLTDGSKVEVRTAQAKKGAS